MLGTVLATVKVDRVQAGCRAPPRARRCGRSRAARETTVPAAITEEARSSERRRTAGRSTLAVGVDGFGDASRSGGRCSGSRGHVRGLVGRLRRGSSGVRVVGAVGGRRDPADDATPAARNRTTGGADR